MTAEDEGPRKDDALERALMVRARGDDAEAFTELVARYEKLLPAYFQRLGARPDEADDAFQETFLRLFAQRRRYAPTASFRSFLFTIAQRAWIDLVRRRERSRRGQIQDFDDGALLGAGPKVSAADRLDLNSALARLPIGQRQAIVLSTLGGLDYKEVGAVLGIPEGTVKSRVFHALRKLREAAGVDRIHGA